MSRKILTNNIEINEKKQISNKANNFFTDIGPELLKEIPEPARSFESYVPKSNTIIPTRPVSVNELKNDFFSIKTNNCPEYDEVNFNAIRSCFDEFCELYNIFLPCLSKIVYFRTTKKNSKRYISI